jgi:type II secretory pathway component PulF
MNIVERTFAKLTFRGQKKVRIMRQLQRLIESGPPLSRSLEMMKAHYNKNGAKKREPLALMIGEWQSRLGQGKSLASAMHGWISVAEEMIIEAGEQSERLASSLEDALKANGAASAITKTILGGLAYPIVLFLFLCFMMYGFATEIAPTFDTIIPMEEWTGKAAVMRDLSNFVVNWALLLAMMLGGALTAIFLSFPILTGPVRPYLDKMPPWSIYKITQAASYMISMRGFLSAGMPIPEALRRMMRTGNPYFKERVGAILARVNMGRNLGEAMKEAGHNFPDDDISGEVAMYAGLDSFTESLDILAREWIDDAVSRAAVASKVLNTVMLILIAGGIMMIASTMYDLQGQVTAATQR